RREARHAATPERVACQPARLALPTLVFRSCQWIADDCTQRPWRFCDAAAVAGKPYCSEHLARVFVRRPHAGAASYGVRW
ncbi:MAG TPA: hypothetical protein VGI78_06000, partial [Acetobacteraceae bacterium]